MRLPRILIAAPSSGAGKTMVTCGILQAFKMRGLSAAAFKCGPDYIDPMFHREVMGIPGCNLDIWMCGREGVREILSANGKGADIAVIEGVMGYYDGLAGISAEASAYDVADTTSTPVILLVDGKGISVSLVPWIQGFLGYRKESHIAGVILNRLTPMMYGRMKKLIEDETSVKVYGYVPDMEDCVIESRYLGLKLPHEIDRLSEQLDRLGRRLEETLELDALYELAASAADLELELDVEQDLERGAETNGKGLLRIGLARDQAFCFMYQDNLRLLKRYGAEIVPFSPLTDEQLPKRLSGLLLYGGYPELYAGELSGNEKMRRAVRQAVRGGMPCMAECGGFMYLKESITDEKGKCYPMTGVLEGGCFYTSSLKRFGYQTLSGGKVFGREVGEIPAHEFHYYDSADCGQEFAAKKPLSERSWRGMVSTDTLLAGYPHLHYYGNRAVAEAFLHACRKYKGEKYDVRNYHTGN